MSSRVGVNLRASAYLHQGDRKYMEDEFQVAYQRTHDKKDIEYAFFGIFDGHGGKEAAHFAKDNLMDNIVSQRSFWSDDDEEVLSAIKEGFIQTHLAMWKVLDQWPKTASGWPSTSGTTASIAFIRRQKIYVGHVGDSGIVLGYGLDNNEWVGESLTRDHKPESILEMNRINECGGKVVAKSGVPRVVWNRPKSGHQGPVRRSTPMDEIPFLAVARSLGDLWSYNAINDRFVVSPEPDVFVKEININIHRCLIFGTDGLWNALSPSTAVNIAFCTEKNNEKHYLGIPMYSGKPRLWINPSRSVVTGALSRYQNVNLRADNTSAVTVFLDPPGRPKREVLLSQYAMKKGSPIKNVPNKPTTRKINKEASVQVHVYNQTQKEGNRGLFRIKERIPENGRNINDDFMGISSIDQDRFHSDSIESSDCDDNFISNLDPGGGVEKPHPMSPCSECGCKSRQDSGSLSSQTTLPPDVAISNLQEANQLDTLNKYDRVKKDDIQIPVVSSSTTAESSSHREGSDSSSSNSSSSNIRINQRRTRSCASLLGRNKSENKKEVKNKFSKDTLFLKTRSSRQSILPTPGDTASRILKSVNRGEKVRPVTPKYATPKRKRSKDIVEEERTPKALRINTRSLKPMITRSQDRTNRFRNK